MAVLPDRPTRRRVARIALLALALAPVTWLSASIDGATSTTLHYERIEASTPAGWPAGLTLEGAWRLSTRDHRFGGISSMLLIDRDTIRYYDDKRFRGEFALPGRPPIPLEIGIVPIHPDFRPYWDVEAVTMDAQSNTQWLAYEHHNAIVRLRGDEPVVYVKPPEMRDWGANSGAEAMVRLADGRFVVLAEDDREGLLFAGDPLEGMRPVTFPVEAPTGFDITDIVQLPDGRALVLMRKLAFALPPFECLLAIGDPAAIRQGQPWRLDTLARLEGDAIRENYEALAVDTAADGALDIWIASDSNRGILQHTNMLKLRWDMAAAKQDAREPGPRAS